ncbi:hypothetical protein [Vibrio paucivorans]|uniref:Copper resistance protein n=1 Tax=Vibrio paucivorans TaxID=2829489 RepID=A0A9X3CB40_9VIBR|nr:hypothetical protein [Vibrio paucivorans]MCW8332407.1 hypothetical protein [Vibrio paucivorans]
MRKLSQHIRGYWSLFMIMIVVLACFGSTLASTNGAMGVTSTTNSQNFAAGESNGVSTLSLEQEPCKLITQLLNHAQSGWEQFAPALLLFTIVLATSVRFTLVAAKTEVIPIQPKRRIHLKHCIFQE